MRALVLFSDRADHPFTRWLKPGYRHVEIMLEVQPETWVGVAGGRGLTIRAGSSTLADLEGWARVEGLTTVLTRTQRDRRYRYLGRVDCVGTVCRVLGLKQAWRVLTPWQLHKRITR